MPELPNEFEILVTAIHVRAGEIHRSLAQHNIRIFCVALNSGGQYDKTLWIHDAKTVPEWRADVREYLEACDERDDEGWADNHVHNKLAGHLRSLGYEEVGEIVADVFEGRITNSHSKIEHDPAHENQPDGFGHYGWENGRNSQ